MRETKIQKYAHINEFAFEKAKDSGILDEHSRLMANSQPHMYTRNLTYRLSQGASQVILNFTSRTGRLILDNLLFFHFHLNLEFAKEDLQTGF
jgi:hypothetical protein